MILALVYLAAIAVEGASLGGEQPPFGLGGVPIAAQQITDVTAEVFPDAFPDTHYLIQYSSRFVAFYCDGTIEPVSKDGSLEWETGLNWVTRDPRVVDHFRWQSGRTVTFGPSRDIVEEMLAPFEAAGFVLGEKREQSLAIGVPPNFYVELLPGDPWCRSTARALSVQSVNPNAGVPITVTPLDKNGQGNGTTPFARSYENNAGVTLTAPLKASGNTFLKWQRNGVDFAETLQTTIATDAAITMTALYESDPPNATCVEFGTGCPPPGSGRPMRAWQFCNIKVERWFVWPHLPPSYIASYSSRQVSIYSNFKLDQIISNWQRETNSLGDGSDPEFYRWLDGKVVAVIDESRHDMVDAFKGEGFRLGDIKYGKTRAAGEANHWELIKTDECDDKSVLPAQEMTELDPSLATGFARSSHQFPGEAFPALTLSFRGNPLAKLPKPKVDLLCATFEPPTFPEGDPWSWLNRTVPTWVVTEGSDLGGPFGEVEVGITPSMLGLSSEYYVTNTPSGLEAFPHVSYSMSPLKLVAIERNVDATRGFKLTYETRMPAGFSVIKPGAIGQAERRYDLVAGHRCHLIYEFREDVSWPAGEWFTSPGNGSINEFLCLRTGANSSEKAIGLFSPGGTFRFKVVDAPGFVNWHVAASTNGVPEEAATLLKRLNNIFGFFNADWSAATGGRPSYAPGEGHAIVSVNGPPFSIYPHRPPDVLFQGTSYARTRHLNYITGKCSQSQALQDRGRDMAELLSGFDSFNGRGEAEFHVTFMGLRPRFPAIRWQTTQVKIRPGERASLNCFVEPGMLPKFQWFRGVSGDISNTISTGIVPVNGDYYGTNSWLITAPLTATTHYWFQVTNVHGFTNSQTIEVLVRTEPDAGKPDLQPPLGQVIAGAGETLDLQAPVSGSFPMTFQWLKDGVPLPGRTDRSLPFTDLMERDAGSYSVIVSNAHGVVTGQVATVTIQQPVSAPTIQQSPTDQTVTAGADVVFAVNAWGSPLNYQWLKDGAAIPNATNRVLVLTNVTSLAAGEYAVMVSNAYGSVTSEPASLVISSGEPGPGTGCGNPPQGLVAWWRGENTYDDAAGSNHGTPVGEPVFAPGKVGQAFAFDGQNDRVELGPINSVVEADEITVMAWVRRAAESGLYASFLGKWNQDFLLYNGEADFAGHGAFLVRFGDAGAPAFGRVTGVRPLPTNEWVHVAATWRRRDGLMGFYVNGQLENSSTNSEGRRLQFTANIPVRLAEAGIAGSPDYEFRGELDEVAIFRRALAPTEIAAIHARGIIPECPPGTSPVANLIQNGSFEDPKVTNGHLYLVIGDALPGGWRVESTTSLFSLYDNADSYGQGFWHPTSAGSQYVYLADNVGVTDLRQELTGPLRATTSYGLSFLQSGWLYSRPFPAEVTVELLPSNSMDAVFHQTFNLSDDAPWTRQRAEFSVPADGAYTLRFLSTQGKVANVDDIAVFPMGAVSNLPPARLEVELTSQAVKVRWILCSMCPENYRLEMAAVADPNAPWTVVPLSPIQRGDQFEVELPVRDSVQFYRLRR